MIYPTDITTRFPGVFDNASDTMLSMVITEAMIEVKEIGWGAYYDTGLLYLAAHKASLTLTAPSSGGASGPVTSKRVGEVSVTFASSTAISSDAELGSTSYGREYLRLRRLLQGGAVTATVQNYELAYQ